MPNAIINELRSEKTGLRCFRLSSTQTELYKHRRWLETGNFPCSENKGEDQLRSYCEAHHSAPLFSHMPKSSFLMMRLKKFWDLIHRNKRHHEKINNVVSKQVWHKWSCMSTEDG